MAVLLTAAFMGYGQSGQTCSQAQGQIQKDQSALSEIFKEIQKIRYEAELKKALAKWVDEGKITKEQALKIAGQWKSQQERNQIIARLRQINDPAKLDEALAKLVGEGKLTREQAVQLKDYWKKR